jgi:hypothetical protein
MLSMSISRAGTVQQQLRLHREADEGDAEVVESFSGRGPLSWHWQIISRMPSVAASAL